MTSNWDPTYVLVCMNIATFLYVLLLLFAPQSYGILVHGYARDYRIADALDVLRKMKDNNLECPERYAFLLRQRCKELSIWHELVPDHPNAWQYSPRAKSHKRSKGKHVNVMKTLVSHQMYNQGVQ
eukprot:gb/GECG01014905.1/.p1 GENE.gb/GECG01014905.1/~~gb/GECG01014905.1/.p1  ORF type:complete len:126 (+),score=9.45 gb/GECG01014905.1/:1-378(+)